MVEEIHDDSPERQADARDLCRTLLQGNPQMPFKEIRQSADNLGLRVSRWMYSAVQRELAGTVGGRAGGEVETTPQSDDGAKEIEAPKSQEVRVATPAAPRQLRDDSKLKSPVMAFTVKFLRERPDAPYRDVRDASEKEGMKLYPITYGRAQALLGIVKAKPRRARRPKGLAGGEGGQKRRALVQGGAQPSNEVEGFIDRAHALAAERDRYRKTLESLRKVLVKALKREEV